MCTIRFYPRRSQSPSPDCRSFKFAFSPKGDHFPNDRLAKRRMILAIISKSNFGKSRARARACNFSGHARWREETEFRRRSKKRIRTRICGGLVGDHTCGDAYQPADAPANRRARRSWSATSACPRSWFRRVFDFPPDSGHRGWQTRDPLFQLPPETQCRARFPDARATLSTRRIGGFPSAERGTSSFHHPPSAPHLAPRSSVRFRTDRPRTPRIPGFSICAP